MSRSSVPLTTSSARFCRRAADCDGLLLAVDSGAGAEVKRTSGMNTDADGGAPCSSEATRFRSST